MAELDLFISTLILGETINWSLLEQKKTICIGSCNSILSSTSIELCQFLALDHDSNDSVDVLDIIHFLNEIIGS